MLVWMGWATFVSGAIALAAYLAERSLRARGRPGRLAWAAALTLSVALGAWTLLRPIQPQMPAGEFTVVQASTTDMAPESQSAWVAPVALRRADPYLRTGWIASSLLLAITIFGGTARLVGRSRTWPVGRVGDDEVLISDDFGPALLGLRTPQVVVPRWAMDLEQSRLDLVVLHEEEHRTAGDAPLLLAGALAVVCAPWNPVLWWQLRRLRGAVEVDCDARVVRRGADPKEYGSLLLDLGSRVSGMPLPIAALAKPPTLLERRLTMIVRGAKPEGTLKTALAVAAVAALTVVACETPPPTAAPLPTEADETSAQLVSEADAKANEFVGQVVAGVEDKSPLVYLDGIRLEGGKAGLAELNPDEIDRIEVLKGEAAKAMFGAEAANGVIQIFTKAASGAELLEVKEGNEARFEPGTEDGSRFEIRATEDGNIRFGADVSKGEPERDADGNIRLQDENGQSFRIVVDGKPYEGKIEDLDKETFDRVEVVKGPDGTSRTVYITLKKRGGG